MTKRDPKKLPDDSCRCGEITFDQILKGTGLDIVESNLNIGGLSGDLKTVDWNYYLAVVDRIVSNGKRVRAKMMELKKIVETTPVPGSDGRCQSKCPGFQLAPGGEFNVLGYCRMFEIKIGPIEYYNPNGCPSTRVVSKGEPIFKEETRRIKGPPIFKEPSS